MRTNMRVERARTGMSASQVAARAGISMNTLLAWERGDTEPLATNLMRLAEIYECTPEYLLGITEGRLEKRVGLS